jgi:hypothetical protein
MLEFFRITQEINHEVVEVETNILSETEETKLKSYCKDISNFLKLEEIDSLNNAFIKVNKS